MTDNVTLRASAFRPRGAVGTVKSWRAILSQVLLTVFTIFFVSPLIWMVATSLKPTAEVFGTPPTLIGSSIEWSNYAKVWTFVPFGRFIIVGFGVALLGTAIVVVTSVLSGYAFSRLHFRGRNAMFLVFLGTLMVPQEVVVVPMFILMGKLGWVNSYAALILPWAFTAFGTFLLRQAFLTVPMELEEAAKIDGANHLQTLLRIMMPVIVPSIAVLTVFTFVGYWNSFLWPLIIVSDSAHSTVPLGLNGFLGQSGGQWGPLMAASAISMLPTALLAIWLQRFLVRGISLSGMGGR